MNKLTEAHILAEVAKYLNPANENVRRGYTIAAVRDLAQIAISGKDHAEDLQSKLDQAYKETARKG